MTSGHSHRAIQWPGWRHLAWTCRYSAGLTALFVVVYGGADLIARQHTHRAALYVSLDDAIPFVPWMTLLYSSLFAMMALTPFILRTRSEVASLARIVALEIVICGAIFLMTPMADRAAPAELGTFAGLYRLADRVNLEYNQFPSLHAAFGFTFASVLGARCRTWGRVGFVAWSLGIAASALLTYQHGIVDIVGAGVLTAILLRAASPGP
jgi:membrane-associated phospholipid phosphatase